MTELVVGNTTGRRLRWLADSYEQAQRIRIEDGERIRAVLQGRDDTWDAEGSVEVPDNGPPWWVDLAGVVWSDIVTRVKGKDRTDSMPDQVLKAICAGSTIGPVPILGRTYARHFEEETELRKEMTTTLKAHPAFPWLDEVRGIGPTLACKILARLDIDKAKHLSSFWSYCGLGTIPASYYGCDTCQLRRSFPPTYKVTGKHKALGTDKSCAGELTLIIGPDGGYRCAQPKPARGEKAAYDQYAKKIMYLVATSFLKAGGLAGGSPYEVIYRKERARLLVERPGWADGRQHLTAMRKMEKLFLAHLFMVWCAAIGREPGAPYVVAEMGHDPNTMIDPWDMVGKATE